MMNTWTKFEVWQYAKLLTERKFRLVGVLNRTAEGTKKRTKINKVLGSVQMRLEIVLDRFNNFESRDN